VPIKLLGSEPGGAADEFGPGDQIGCGHDDFRQRVGINGVKRQVAQPGGFG
jgi:hypothetical protein